MEALSATERACIVTALCMLSMHSAFGCQWESQLSSNGVLDLSYTGMEKLHPGSFTNCSDIRQLLLKGNMLREIPSNAFVGLRRAYEIDLSSNQLRKVPGILESLVTIYLRV